MEGGIIDLGGGYSARPISLEAYRRACAALEDQIFGGTWTYDFGPPSKAPPPLGESFSWGIYHHSELIGWSHAHQTDERTVCMADTGLLPAHQGHGLYTRLLPWLLETFRAAGYALVTSRHRATNTRVLVPKLRAGFVVQGLNLYEGGLSAALTLSLDPAYREAQHVRSGFRQAQGEAARRLGVRPIPASNRAAPTPPTPPGVPLPATTGPAHDLGGGYRLHPVTFDTYLSAYAALESAAYSTVSLDWPDVPSVTAPDWLTYAWLVERGGEVVGWQYSRQWDTRTAYMVNTALLPAHRGQGVYTRLLPPVLDTLRAAGYTLVRSHHHATNSAVLVPKLRAGFALQGLEVDSHGVMAVLLLSFDAAYRDYMDLRSGLKRPAGEAARRIGLEGTHGP